MDTASLTHPGAFDAARPHAAPRAGACGGVRIEHLSVRYGARTVLDDLSLEIGAGELLAVLGKSGCGKTTLLRFIAGFVKADGLTGTLAVAGRDLTHAPPHKRNLGLLFQNYALFPHLTVFENVAFGCARGACRPRTSRGASPTRSSSCSSATPAITCPRNCRAACSSASRSRARS